MSQFSQRSSLSSAFSLVSSPIELAGSAEVLQVENMKCFTSLCLCTLWQLNALKRFQLNGDIIIKILSFMGSWLPELLPLENSFVHETLNSLQLLLAAVALTVKPPLIVMQRKLGAIFVLWRSLIYFPCALSVIVELCCICHQHFNIFNKFTPGSSLECKVLCQKGIKANWLQVLVKMVKDPSACWSLTGVGCWSWLSILEKIFMAVGLHLELPITTFLK